MTQWRARGWMCVGVLYGLSLMALKMATFDRDVDFWRSYGAGGRNSVEKIELEAETQSWINVGNGHVVHQMTQKIVALSPISRPRIYCSFLLTFLTLGCFFYGLGLFIFKGKSRMPACISLERPHFAFRQKTWQTIQGVAKLLSCSWLIELDIWEIRLRLTTCKRLALVIMKIRTA